MFDFITADTHFDHPGIIKHCERPYVDIEAMNESMMDNWNGIVGKRDSVAVIGDFAWKRHGRWLNELNGRITLITGNHDKMPIKVAENFTQAIGKDRYPGILEYRIDNQPVVLCHYPLYSWRWGSHGAWMLHGHSHGRVEHPEHVLSLDVGVDLWGFTPVPWEVICARMGQKMKARDEYMKSVDRPVISYWTDVIRPQYRDNMRAWRSVQTKKYVGLAKDPRDL